MTGSGTPLSAALVALVVLALVLASGMPRAEAEETAIPSATAPYFPDTPPSPVPTNRALDLRSPPPQEPKPSLFRQWWFWTAVGAAVVATVVVIVASSRGHAPPTTDLGNQEF
jgi:hypothetical protein